MHTIFISYNHQDAGFTERLASDLQQSGLSIWIDDLGISFGSNWGNAVGDGLEKCDSMILVVSKPSMASKNVTDEWNYFHDKNKTIIPVLIENVARPFQLQRLKYVDFVGQPYNKAFDSLKAQLLQQPVTSKPRSSQLTMLLKPVLLGELIMALLRRLNEPWAIIIAAVIGLSATLLLINSNQGHANPTTVSASLTSSSTASPVSTLSGSTPEVTLPDTYRASLLADNENLYVVLPSQTGKTVNLSTLEFRAGDTIKQSFSALFFNAATDAVHTSTGTCFRLTTGDLAAKVDPACNSLLLRSSPIAANTDEMFWLRGGAWLTFDIYLNGKYQTNCQFGPKPLGKPEDCTISLTLN